VPGHAVSILATSFLKHAVNGVIGQLTRLSLSLRSGGLIGKRTS